MNNNSFALMRYLRDLGADAHLLLYANDGVGGLSHFSPESDTWEIRKWSPFIHRLTIVNSNRAIVGLPHRLILPHSRTEIRRQLGGYDRYIASGIAPALLLKAGLSLDIYYPYATGIEYVDTHEVQGEMRSSLVRRAVMQYVRRRQVMGIQRARHCLSADMSFTAAAFARMGIKPQPITVPMVYNREMPSTNDTSELLSDFRARLSGSEFAVFSHARLRWTGVAGLTDKESEEVSKHNDWLFRGFAIFLKRHPQARAVLCAVEYGPDVPATKRLCAELGIEDAVMWLPKLMRKEIMYALSLCDVGVGEFQTSPGIIWGGTAWEVLASGLPLLQTFGFTETYFVETFGYCPPPILNVESPGDVAQHLERLFSSKDLRESFGRAARKWFDQNSGFATAARWLDLLSVRG